MRKMIVIAVREYLAAVKTKAFIASLVLMPVMMFGSIAVPYALRDRVDTSDKRIAILDHTETLLDGIQAAATERNEAVCFQGDGDDRKQVKPRFVIESVAASSDDPAKVDLALSERVREGELLAFVVIGRDVLEPGEDSELALVRYHSNSPTYRDFVRWFQGPLNSKIQRLRFAQAHLDPDLVAKATAPAAVQNLGLVSVNEAGEIIEAEETNRVANLIVPFGLMMLMFMLVMIGASPLLQSVLEEKMQRIAEVLLASVTPFQLMMGKLIGMVGVSLTIGTCYLVGAFIAINQAGYGQFFPTHVIWWFVLFQALSVLMFGALFVAVGAAVTDMKESQSMMTPIMLVVVAPMFVMQNVISEPSSTLATVLSLIPPLTPTLMLLRLTIPPGIPIWQPLLGVVLVLITTTVFVFAAGRIFRVGILMQGKGANFGDMLRWVFRG